MSDMRHDKIYIRLNYLHYKEFITATNIKGATRILFGFFLSRWPPSCQAALWRSLIPVLISCSSSSMKPEVLSHLQASLRLKAAGSAPGLTAPCNSWGLPRAECSPVERRLRETWPTSAGSSTLWLVTSSFRASVNSPGDHIHPLFGFP